MSVQNVGSNLAALLTLVILLGVATLGFCSVVPLASSAADVIVLPLTVKGLSSTDDPAISNDRSPFADCGVANGNPVLAGGKIIGGVETAPNEFPWQAYLQVEMESGNIYSCAGSLVSERWILTSAGCATEENENTKSILVYLGLHSRSNSSTEANAKMYEGQDLLVHSGWNPYSFVNNTALVYLSTTVTFTQYIRPACLADPTEPSYLGEYVTVTGWGATSDADTTSGNSEVLRKLTVPVISNAQCNSYYYVFDNEMCTSGDNSQGICVGDNGGPLNFKQPDGTWKQIGIVSFWPSAGCTRAGYPTIYMRLSSLSTWVQQIIASPETTPTAPTDAPTVAPTDAPTTTQTTTQQSTTTKSPTTTSIETTVTTTQKTTTPTTTAPTTTTTAAPTTPTTTTASITNQPTTFSCAGKANGNYANPASNCSNTFYKCSNGNAYLYNCAATLVYREEIGACDWPSNVAGCN